MEYKYVPKQCEGPEASFEGYVMLKGLDFDKKMELLEQLSSEGLDFANIAEIAEKEPGKMLGVLRRLVSETKDLWGACHLKDIKGEVELKSRQDVASYNRSHAILIDVAMHALGGASLGN